MIGRQVVDLLCDMGAKVTSVSLDGLRLNPKADYALVDLTDFNLCKAITTDIDYVFHIAGIKGNIEVTKTMPASFFVPVMMMNTNMLEACRINKIKRIVYTSTIGAYAPAEIFTEEHNFDGVPMDMFPGWAKRMGELQIKAYGIQYGLDNFAIVRLGSVYGPGDNFNPNNAMVIPSLIHRIKKDEGPLVVWGTGNEKRDFTYSKDIAYGIIQALIEGTDSEPVNLGSGKSYSIKEVVETLNSFIDFNYEFDNKKPSGYPRRVVDISLAQKLFNYNPTTTLSDGLRQTWDWYNKHPNEYQELKNYFHE